MSKFLCGYRFRFLGLSLGVALLGYVVTLCSVFVGAASLFSWVSVPLHRWLLCTCCCLHLVLASLKSGKWCLTEVVIWISLMTHDDSSLILLVRLHVSFGKAFRSFAHFSMGHLSFYNWVVRSLYIFWIFPIRYMICKYFLPFSWLFFHLLDGVLGSTEVLHFDEVLFMHFSL